MVDWDLVAAVAAVVNYLETRKKSTSQDSSTVSKN